MKSNSLRLTVQVSQKVEILFFPLSIWYQPVLLKLEVLSKSKHFILERKIFNFGIELTHLVDFVLTVSSGNRIGIKEALKQRPLFIAGPCSIESESQIKNTASELAPYGVNILRGGAFKPRTSPDSFQGLGEEGLKFMRQAADENNMHIVTEVLETEHLKKYYAMIDMIQIGSRNMSSFGFLKEVGKISSIDQKPVLLKRGFSATLNELLSAAQYIINEGNSNVYLCLRGIRTFEQIDSAFRFTPDLGSIIELKEKTDLPVLFDPSHASGNAKYVKQLSKAAISLGADGLLIESHYQPENAMSDKDQCIHPSLVSEIISEINSSYEYIQNQ